MGKELATRYNFDLEVVETKALVDEWKGVALTWWSVDGKLLSKLFKAYEALGGGKGPGAYRSKVQKQTSKVQSWTLKDFYEGIGMKKQTFYNFINRTKGLIEAGADIENMSGSMKAIADMTGKTEREIELEELVAKQTGEIANRESARDQYKADAKKEQAKVAAGKVTIQELKAKAEAQTEPNPELLKKITELEKRQTKLEKDIDWYTSAADFKAKMTGLLDQMGMVETLGKRLISTKKPK